MVLIMTDEIKPEDRSPNQSVPERHIDTSHVVPLSSQEDASSSSLEVGATMTNHCHMHSGYDGTSPQWEGQPCIVSRESLMLTHHDVQAENNSFVHHINSHAYAPCYSSVGNFQQKIPDQSELMPVYSCYSKQSSENPQAKPRTAIASEAKNSTPRDAGILNSKNLKFIKNDIEPLNSRTLQVASSSGISGHSVKPYKSPPKFLGGQPIGVIYAARFSNQTLSQPHRGQNGSLPGNTFNGSRSLYPAANNNYKSYGASNELVRGPRATRVMPDLSSSADKDSWNPYLRKDNYNKPDFQVKFEHAKFFMIKSYSEDDIHRSIKYSVWASTPNGNNKLDAAFKMAEMEKMEKGTPCPVFLFFSVNASGQFVGLAEMTGPVDFKKNMDFWQQDKWNGFFPVKWHIIKDIPNRNFHHITLENNENKTVTFSRDTQEINLPQGLSMLQIFKAYLVTTSILDDTDFYEEKEKEKEKEKTPCATNMNYSDDSSMMHLESSFGNMSMSSRVENPHDTSANAPSNFIRRTSFSNHSPFNSC